MTRAASFAFHAMHLALLRGASLMVPGARRAEWFREWASELWHVRRGCMPIGAFSWTAERELTAFCAGSFRDAACLRRQNLETGVAPASVHGSARQCLLWLFTVVAMCAIIAQFLQGIQSEKEAAKDDLRPGVILIQGGSYGDAARPSIPFAQYRDWQSRRQRFFADLAYYRVEREGAEAGGMNRGTWAVAHASESLFDLLGADLPVDETDRTSGISRAVLSQSLWRRAFHSDPGAIGAVITVAHRDVRIMGVAPAGTWRLPGHADLWVMETDVVLGRPLRFAPGFVIALLSPLGQAEMSVGANAIATLDPDGEEVEYHGVTFAPQTGGLSAIYFFALLLAVLALPAITSVFQSESSFASHQPPLKTRAKRWLFLASKVSLIAALGYFAGLDIAYWNFADYSPTAEFLQFAATFTICLFGLRWALMDQSRRCPVCLRRVTHPARVGIASCNFLGWNGTEMICMGGHALLHVPSLPTSWFDRQRWMYLDTSWDFLFVDTVN